MGYIPSEQAHRPRTGRPVPIGTETGCGACGKPQARPPVTGKAPGARVVPQSQHPYPGGVGSRTFILESRIIKSQCINNVALRAKLGIVYLPAP